MYYKDVQGKPFAPSRYAGQGVKSYNFDFKSFDVKNPMDWLKYGLIFVIIIMVIYMIYRYFKPNEGFAFY
jgi:hypothetical protein